MKPRGLFLLIFGLVFATKAQAADYANFLEMQFKTVSAGVFYMGSCKPADGDTRKKSAFFGLVPTSVCPSGGSVDPAAEPDELPQHKVEISKAFQLGVHEVTLAQYQVFLEATNQTITERFKKVNSHGANAAVAWVSWFQIRDFLAWLNQNKPAHDRGTYRLPTEAEWEYAARAGSNTVYFFGDKRFEISRFAWVIKDSQSYGQVWSQPVGIKQPNPWGFYDIYGNVQEWTQDAYGERFYANSPQQDPQGVDSGRTQVIRGCSLYHSARNCRSAKRFHLPADQRKGTVGFRVARTLP